MTSWFNGKVESFTFYVEGLNCVQIKSVEIVMGRIMFFFEKAS